MKKLERLQKIIEMEEYIALKKSDSMYINPIQDGAIMPPSTFLFTTFEQELILP